MLKLACLAMRTRFEIVLPGDDQARLRAAGEEALAEIQRVEASLSAFREDSDLYRINALAAKQRVKVDARVIAFLQRALAFSEATDGAFDMASGALLTCWNLKGMADGAAGRIPSEQEIEAARAVCGMRANVVLDAEQGTVKFAREGVRLDPGALGKGYALQRAADILRDNGISSALLHGGTSTVCAIGAPPDSPAWKIAVRHPFDEKSNIATAKLCDTTLSVSAVHGKSFVINGKRYGHVIDPRSGWPVSDNVLAAVIHPDALASDALSTALLVLGAEGMRTLAQRYPDASFLLARENEMGELKRDVLGAGFL